ncbi:MAG: zinc dependent phospholipase C family protein [Segetibacter sp.]
MRSIGCAVLFLFISIKSFCWGFYAHQRINYFAVFLLPPEMLVLYKPSIQFLSDHSVDPDKRRYAIPEEAPRHYIDIDNYGAYPYTALPRKWEDAIQKFSEDTIQANGIVPWWIAIMQQRLTNAFKEKNQAKILKLSAEIGHYIADAHVPLHASSNHDGQNTNQRGIHGFWESRVPELLAENEFDFMIGKAGYVADITKYTWSRVLESGVAADTVLRDEAALTKLFPTDRKYAFEERSGKLVRQYSTEFTTAYNKVINNMVERRMRQAISSVASYWYTAWVNAGQPDLKNLNNTAFTEEDLKEFEKLNADWKNTALKGRMHE